MNNFTRIAHRYRSILEPGAFNKTDGWTVLSNDTDNLTTDEDRVWSDEASLEFDKVDGAGDTKLCGVYRTFDAPTLKQGTNPTDGIGVMIKLSTLVDVDYVWWRLGTSASNYREWRSPRNELTAGEWGVAAAPLNEFTIGGTNPDLNKCTYCAIGVAFLVETDTLADIYLDGFAIVPNHPFNRHEGQSLVVDGTSFQSEEGAVVSPDTDVGTTPVALAVPHDAKFLRVKGHARIRFGSNATLDGTADDGYATSEAYEWSPPIPVLDMTTMYVRIDAASGTTTVHHYWEKRTS